MNSIKTPDLLQRAFNGDGVAQERVNREFTDMYNFQKNMMNDVKKIEHAIAHGLLETRADPTHYSGECRNMIERFNATLDNVTELLKISIDYTGQLSRGILPEKINGTYYGDSNKFKTNLNNCINVFNGISNDAGDSIEGTISPMKSMDTKNWTSNFSEPVESTEHMQENKIFMKHHELSSVLSTIGQQVSDIADQNQRMRKNTTKLASDTARVARNASAVHFYAGQGEEEVCEILNNLKELSAGTQKISSEADAMLRLASTTYKRTGNVTEHANQIKNVFIGISSTATEADARLSEILGLAKQISDITDQMFSLSDQAKMLAEHASDGRTMVRRYPGDYPVTRQELTYLATVSRESAEKTVDLMSELQKKSRMAQSALETMYHELQKGDMVFNDTSELFSHVSGSIEQISRNMALLSTASRDQGRSIMKLTTRVQNVKYVVSGTVQKASDVAKACNTTSSSLFQVAHDMVDVHQCAKKIATGTVGYQE